MRLPCHFSHYLAGFWEGVGHADRRGHTFLTLTVHKKNKPLLDFFQQCLGGTLREKSSQQAYLLTLRKPQTFTTFFSHIHNKLRTPKHSDLQGFSLSPGHKDLQHILENGWLAGFVDAYGTFKIRWRHETRDPRTQNIRTKHRIGLSFVLEHLKWHPYTGESYQPIMEQIGHAFDVPLQERDHEGKEFWCVTLSGLKKLEILIAYLKTFPLLSSKVLDFEDWKEVYALVCAGTHEREEGKERIWNLRHRLHRHRQVVCWKHVEKKTTCFLVPLESGPPKVLHWVNCKDLLKK